MKFVQRFSFFVIIMNFFFFLQSEVSFSYHSLRNVGPMFPPVPTGYRDLIEFVKRKKNDLLHKTSSSYYSQPIFNTGWKLVIS